MIDKTCPKCTKKSEDLIVCSSCGLNFEEYEVSKQEKLIEIHTLLSEGKYHDAKEIAEKLSLQFPDNRTDFILLLSNINRDISIVAKCDQAYNAYKDEDYKQASFLLRNIKAFNPVLNEQVIGLRRKAERHLRNDDTFREGVTAFDEQKYGSAKKLFRQIRGFQRQNEVDEYLVKIDGAIREILDEAIGYIQNRQYNLAENKFRQLQTGQPDLQVEIDGYLTLLAGRIEIKNSIIDAAEKAEEEKRYLESKILYTFLGMQFPEFSSLVQPYLDEISSRAITGLAELPNENGIDFATLHLDKKRAGYTGWTTPTDDINSITAVQSNQMGKTDMLCPPVKVDVEGVDDFIF